MNRSQADTFICHAREDKEAIARPIHKALTEVGVYAWLDEFEIRLGHSIRQKIDEGLANCRSATIILSRSFFSKNWPQYEMDGIVGRLMQGEILLFPIQHGITIEEIRDYSPSLAELSLWNSSDRSPADIACEIANQLGIAKPTPIPDPTTPMIQPHGGSEVARRCPRFWHILHSTRRHKGTRTECGTRTRCIAPFHEPNRLPRMDPCGGKQRGARVCHRGSDSTHPIKLG